MHNFYMIISGLLVFGIIVFIHELGHYLAARWRHIRVDVFSIGFGPALCSWSDRVGTRWQLSLLPLGGYVKLHGFDKGELEGERQEIEKLEGEAKAGVKDIPYHQHPVLSRMIVSVMGPLFNILLTILLFVLLMSLYGKPVVKSDIGALLPGGAAEKAGLHVGDKVQSLNGHKILNIADFQAQIAAHPTENVQIGVLRQGEAINVPVTLDSQKTGHKTIGRLGVAFNAASSGPLPFYKAIPEAFVQTWQMTCQIFEGLWQIVSGQRSARQLTGTIGIIHMSGEVVSYGFAAILSFVAMLSLNLGLINLLPVPMLDGGHLLFYSIEAIRRKPLSERVQAYALQAGILLVVFLFLFSTYNDLNGLGLFHWLSAHYGR